MIDLISRAGPHLWQEARGMDLTLSALRTISLGSVVSLFTISRFRIGTVGLKICNSSCRVYDMIRIRDFSYFCFMRFNG